MNASSTIALVAVVIASAVAVWSLVEVARAMRSLRALTDDSRERVVPLLEKVDVTVDAVNAELLRVDAIITRFEDASERVSSASGTITDIVNAPSELVSGVALKVRRAWRERRRDGGTGAAHADDAAIADSPGPQEHRPQEER